MHLGLFLHCEQRAGASQDAAFGEAFGLADIAEKGGLDSIWLAELHFASQAGHASGRVPSVAASPLILATALACRTQRAHVGIAVSLLPLAHPVRLAEEVATLDQISGGRLELGVGRSAFPIAYAGYGVPYEESRERFEECLEILLRAWTEETFSYEGKYNSFTDVSVIPRPYQKPHPPIRVASSTQDTFSMMGSRGYPIFVRMGSSDAGRIAGYLDLYRESWQRAEHPGSGDVILSLPVFVAETAERAYAEPKESTVSYYRRLAERFARTAAATGNATAVDRAERAEGLASADYDEMLRDRLVFGTPEAVAERLSGLRDSLGLSGVIIEPNPGGAIGPDSLARSVRLFA